MTDSGKASSHARATPATPAPPVAPSRAGRNLPAAIASGVVLGVAIITSLVFWKPAFMIIVVAAVLVAVWELGHAFATGEIRIAREPVMAGGVVMVLVAYFFGAPALVTATAVTALGTMLWRLRGRDHGLRDGHDRRGLHDRLRAVPRLVRGAAARRGPRRRRDR